MKKNLLIITVIILLITTIVLAIEVSMYKDYNKNLYEFYRSYTSLNQTEQNLNDIRDSYEEVELYQTPQYIDYRNSLSTFNKYKEIMNNKYGH